ncbi:uncharacterized protein M6B38_297015 [Iris pallida]|uniref:Reverse transcriptase Ty1/copia-type domain-containing protein n=1 Tax=Iris pallida TaxID=29817 RepID=A0AAX6HSV0_IRIPA|nr:uncharacterized protein M6B38_297015 [Iris pallida]
MMNSMLLTAGLPKCYWGEATLTATFILNRVPYATSDITPHELWFKVRPNLNVIRVWGCLAYVKLPDLKIQKLGTRTTKAIFLGYAEKSDARRFLDIESNHIIESRDAEYFEDKFAKYKNIILADLPENDEGTKQTEVFNEPVVLDEAVVKETPAEPELAEPSSKRTRRPKDFGDDFVTYHVEADPLTYDEAMKTRDAVFWKEAIDNEIDSITSNNTLVLVDLPEGARPIGCKWIFKKKMKANGTIDKFKARLVAKGFAQKQGIDYFDTYAPVARMTTIRLLIALAAIHKLVIHQMDVKTVFLNGELTEEIYMQQPKGFVVRGLEDKVCKLIKSLYGLKQAPKMWHEKFDKVIRSNGYRVSKTDKCVYTKFADGRGVIVCLYVDDMLILGMDLSCVTETKKFLSTKFSMKDLGEADVILGLKIIRTGTGIALSQSHYIEKMLICYGYQDLPIIDTPNRSDQKLEPNSKERVRQLEYASIIGSLMYATTATRPDIAFVVGMLSRFTSNPDVEHWKAVKRVMRYLKKTQTYALFYSGDPSVVEGFSDASWCSDMESEYSTGGFVFAMDGAAISWKSKKQTMLSRSSMESEFFALDAAADEAE